MENILERNEIVYKLKKICDEYTDILGLVILFGSYARNEATDASDIDLYIEPKDISVTSSKLGNDARYKNFKYSLYDNFDNEFDLLTYGGKRELTKVRKSPLWRQIEKDGILIYDQRAETV